MGSKNFKKVTAYFDEKEILYSVNEDSNCLLIRCNGEHCRDISLKIFFDPDEDRLVAFRAFSIARFMKNQLPMIYEFCNRKNNQYRWVKFYVDDDNELAAAIDAIVDYETVDTECHELLGRMLQIVDAVYGDLYS